MGKASRLKKLIKKKRMALAKSHIARFKAITEGKKVNVLAKSEKSQSLFINKEG